MKPKDFGFKRIVILESKKNRFKLWIHPDEFRNGNYLNKYRLMEFLDLSFLVLCEEVIKAEILEFKKVDINGFLLKYCITEAFANFELQSQNIDICHIPFGTVVITSETVIRNIQKGSFMVYQEVYDRTTKILTCTSEYKIDRSIDSGLLVGGVIEGLKNYIKSDLIIKRHELV